MARARHEPGPRRQWPAAACPVPGTGHGRARGAHQGAEYSGPVPEALRCYRHPDRETGVSCSECGRGICPDCMVFAPVGIRCPDHAGGPAAGRKPSPVKAGRRWFAGDGAYVTRALVIINVGVFLLNLLEGASLSNNSGSVFIDGALVGKAFDPATGHNIGVGEGEWYRMITAMFLHAGLLHLGLN